MKFLFAISLYLFSNLLFAGIDDTLNRIDSAGKKQGHWIITGAMAKNPNFKPDQKYEEGNYVNNNKEGLWYQYHATGTLRLKALYINNRPNGLCTLYYENGHIEEIGTFNRNRWCGEYKLFYDTDTLRMHFQFDSLGKRNGLSYYWSPKGKIQLIVNYQNGKEIWKKEYYEDGSLSREDYYIDSAYSIEHPPKEVIRSTNPEPLPIPKPAPPCGPHVIGECVNGKLVNGKEYIYDNDGLLTQIKWYKDGKYVGDAPLPTDENR